MASAQITVSTSVVSQDDANLAPGTDFTVRVEVSQNDTPTSVPAAASFVVVYDPAEVLLPEPNTTNTLVMGIDLGDPVVPPSVSSIPEKPFDGGTRVYRKLQTFGNFANVDATPGIFDITFTTAATVPTAFTIEVLKFDAPTVPETGQEVILTTGFTLDPSDITMDNSGTTNIERFAGVEEWESLDY
jgi:hypothetical protein